MTPQNIKVVVAALAGAAAVVLLGVTLVPSDDPATEVVTAPQADSSEPVPVADDTSPAESSTTTTTLQQPDTKVEDRVSVVERKLPTTTTTLAPVTARCTPLQGKISTDAAYCTGEAPPSHYSQGIYTVRSNVTGKTWVPASTIVADVTFADGSTAIVRHRHRILRPGEQHPAYSEEGKQIVEVRYLETISEPAPDYGTPVSGEGLTPGNYGSACTGTGSAPHPDPKMEVLATRGSTATEVVTTRRNTTDRPLPPAIVVVDVTFADGTSGVVEHTHGEACQWGMSLPGSSYTQGMVTSDAGKAVTEVRYRETRPIP